MKTTLNFIPLITEGDEFQNIRVFDGDRIIIKKSNKLLINQFFGNKKNKFKPRYCRSVRKW